MARFSAKKINGLFKKGDLATTTTEQGRALEDLIAYVFSKVPGIDVTKRNELNSFLTEEIDVAFWNNCQRNGLHFLPNIILVECKNWSSSLGSQEVAYFIQRLQNRGRDFGILVASNGITGTSEDRNRAHYEIAMALSRGIRVIVITRDEIVGLTETTQLVNLIKEKLCELVVSGTVFLDD